MAALPDQADVMRAIVFITSISAEVSSVSRGEYCMSKAALSMAVICVMPIFSSEIQNPIYVEKGVIIGSGVYEAGKVRGTPAMAQAYEMGKNV